MPRLPSHIFTHRNIIAALTIFLLGLLPSQGIAQEASAILRAAFDNWRAQSSHAVIEMTIKRAGSSRNLTMESWTKGTNKALVRFIKPARDAGNGTLQSGRNTWIFNPKLNQVIKLPASAMAQSWMGSDFSYNDLAKTDRIITDYTHKITSTRKAGGKKIYVIEAIPKKGKPIVWGKQVLEVRSDGVLISVGYFDQRGILVRKMTAERIAMLGGRPYPVVMTMKTAAKPGQFTQITTISAEFNIAIPAYIFTKSNLQNPR